MPNVPHSSPDGPVVDEGHERACDELAEAPGVSGGVLHYVIGLEPVAAGLVEQDARHCPRRSRGHSPLGAGRATSFVNRTAGGDAGELLHVEVVEQLEADGAGHGLVPGLHAGVSDGHAGHCEAGADLASETSSPSLVAISRRRRLSP